MLDLAGWFDRVGLDDGVTSLDDLHRAQVTSIPYENLDVQLARDVTLDLPSLVAKSVDSRRGGYCFELNTLFAAVLETLGHRVTRLLGRVRLSDTISPRPATHMVLLVDDTVIDVGFGGATPLGPIPLEGEATHGPWTWHTERIGTPEGEDAWGMWFYEMLLYTFTDQPRHPVDFVAPNHFTATHPNTIFKHLLMVQRWDHDNTQVGLVDRDLTIRRHGLPDETTRIDSTDLGTVLADRFGIVLDPTDLAQLQDQLQARSTRPN